MSYFATNKKSVRTWITDVLSPWVVPYNAV